jgi:hypothetical protein
VSSRASSPNSSAAEPLASPATDRAGSRNRQAGPIPSAAQARRHHAKTTDHRPLSQSCLFAC